MKKLIALVALTVSLGVHADSYLYWMVSDSITMDDKAFDSSNYKYAAIGLMDNKSGQNAGYLNLYLSDQSFAETFVTPANGSAFYANLANFTEGYSFYIELFNDSLESKGRSKQILDYEAAKRYAYSFGIGTPPTQDMAWAPSAFTTAAVPEPSSALLMLLGCAGLALKRKKQAKA